MIGLSTSTNWIARLRGSLGSFLLLVVLTVGCSGDGPDLLTEAALPADSAATAPTDTTAAPADTITTPPVDSTNDGAIVPAEDSSFEGITFGTYNLPPSYLTAIHNGTRLGATPTSIVATLTAIREKGGHVVIKLCKGKDDYVQNADGTFSLAKWKENVGVYRNVNLDSFVADGTILGHFLIDEPHRAVRWGGKAIPQATIEAMAAYSKQLWPNMPALVRVAPSWLAAAPVTYVHLDAGWLQYATVKGEVNQLVTAEVAAAKQKALGILVGLNVLDGGDGSSKIPGGDRGKWAMSATELRTYGTALLDQSYACAFYMWSHDISYYDRTDVKNAMAELSVKARAHRRTSCRQ
jgi:hypothetical protein